VRVELQEEAERRRVAGGEEGQQAGRRRRHRLPLVKRSPRARACAPLSRPISIGKIGPTESNFQPKILCSSVMRVTHQPTTARLESI
jgi:hypothetical protein